MRPGGRRVRWPQHAWPYTQRDSGRRGRRDAPAGPPPGRAAGPAATTDPLAGARAHPGAGLYFSEYEPVVSLHSGQVVAYEALARFLRPDGAGRLARHHVRPAARRSGAAPRAPSSLLKRHQLDHAPAGGRALPQPRPGQLGGRQRRRRPQPARRAPRGRAPGRVVVEVTETLDEGDSAMARELIASLRAPRAALRARRRGRPEQPALLRGARRRRASSSSTGSCCAAWATPAGRRSSAPWPRRSGPPAPAPCWRGSRRSRT